MPSLRERLERIWALFETKLLGPEAKLDAIEANIGLLAKQLGLPRHQQELAKANRRYDESRTAWARLEVSLREQVSEAKAETEKLHKRKAWWEHSVESWKAEEISWREEMDELRAELESLKANADLGKMVRDIVLDKAG